MTDELVGHDAVDLDELVRRREVTPTELLDLTIRRIERLNGTLNAVVERRYDHARQIAARRNLARGVLRGPFLLKDLIAECEGTPFSGGSRAVRSYRSRLDSDLVQRHEATLFRLAAQLEEARPWAHRRPAIHCAA